MNRIILTSTNPFSDYSIRKLRSIRFQQDTDFLTLKASTKRLNLSSEKKTIFLKINLITQKKNPCNQLSYLKSLTTSAKSKISLLLCISDSQHLNDNTTL